MTKYVVDTNLYIAADRDVTRAEEMIAFFSAHLPFTYLHAVVAQELLLGAVDVRRERLIQESVIAPFETRNRLIAPSFQSWKRSGQVVAALIQRRVISPGGFGRSFLNDVLLATSCREAGAALITNNTADFERIRQVERFEFVPPWPGS